MSEIKSAALDWDSVIEDDGKEYIILPEGDYNFTVSSFERGRFPGSQKMDPCPKATLSLIVDYGDVDVTVKTDLLLSQSMTWKISGFFRCIGKKKHGERLQMKWDEVPGSKGRAHFKPRSFTGKDGSLKQANDVDRFIDWDESFFDVKPVQMEVLDDDEEGLPF